MNEPMPDVPVGDWTALFADIADPDRPDLQAGEIDPRVLRRARAGYYGHMSHIDHQINHFLERLADFGQLRNSYICFVSDHGELLGDHHLFRKAFPFEGSARVPLILAGPKGSGIRKNAVCSQVVELRDVMPTLLDCAGLPVPEGVEGQSLLPFARGEEVPWRAYLHGEHIIP